MNIFVLDRDPIKAAEYHCDRHCCKMIIEHTQMLAAAYYHTIGISRKKEISEKQQLVDSLFEGFPRKRPDGSDHPYGISHYNHPCTIWTRESIENWNWLHECTVELCNQFKLRWSGKEHSIKAILDWMLIKKPNLQSKGLTKFATAMNESFISQCPIESYRKYYEYKDSVMDVRWKNGNIPFWYFPNKLQSKQKPKLIESTILLAR